MAQENDRRTFHRVPLLDEVVLLANNDTTYRVVNQDIDLLRDQLLAHYTTIQQGDQLHWTIPSKQTGDSNTDGPVALIVLASPVPSKDSSAINSDINHGSIAVEAASDDDNDSVNELFITSRLFGNTTSTAPIDEVELPPKQALRSILPIVQRRSRVSSATTRRTPPSIQCTARYLPSTATTNNRPIISSSIQDELFKDNDECNTIFANTLAMAQTGLIEGDWASNHLAQQPRYCRVYAYNGNTLDKQMPCVYLQPELAFNLHIDTTDKQLDSIYLRRSSLATKAALPTASAVTIARIASPRSANRTLLLANLKALTEWLRACPRVVQQNDVIRVVISEEQGRIGSMVAEMDVEIDERDESTAAEHIRASTIDDVYFKVTKLTCNDPEFDGTARIIPSITQVTQTGTEQSRVPPRNSLFTVDTPEYDSLVSILRSGMHPWAAELQMKCTVLVTGARGIGKSTLVANAANQLGVHLLELNCYELIGDTETKTIEALKVHFERAIRFAPCLLLLKHAETLAKKSTVAETGQEPLITMAVNEGLQKLAMAHQQHGHPIMLVATTDDVDALSVRLLGSFPQQIDLMAPDEQQRRQILDGLLKNTPLALDVSLASIATQTAAFIAKDLRNIVQQATIAALELKENDQLTDDDLVQAGVQLTGKDFDLALGQARSSFSDSIGAPKIPNVTWDDVGGLASVKKDILDTIQLPLEHPELFASGVKKRSGVLFYGPPGTGKTLLAKAVATSCSLNFFSVKGPELLNMYIGESEANVRRVFQRARDARPCVIFFDELDSVAPKRGEKGDSGGVMDRIVSQLLAELDGMADSSQGGGGDVFVIGATNRPDLLDPALLRPGRFDKLLYLGISEDHESQLNIIKALTRKFHLHPDLDLRQVANQCPFNYTGADFYALCSDAMLKAMTRVANAVEEKVAALNAQPQPSHIPLPITVHYFFDHMASEEDICVQVTLGDFELALQELSPSISMQELNHYKSVRDKFQQTSPDPSNTALLTNELLSTPPSSPRHQRTSTSTIQKPTITSLQRQHSNNLSMQARRQQQQQQRKRSESAPIHDIKTSGIVTTTSSMPGSPRSPSLHHHNQSIGDNEESISNNSNSGLYSPLGRSNSNHRHRHCIRGDGLSIDGSHRSHSPSPSSPRLYKSRSLRSGSVSSSVTSPSSPRLSFINDDTANLLGSSSMNNHGNNDDTTMASSVASSVSSSSSSSNHGYGKGSLDNDNDTNTRKMKHKQSYDVDTRASTPSPTLLRRTASSNNTNAHTKRLNGKSPINPSNGHTTKS
ncbi:P-loop containing nucleoside triphosphate hydrolase protein [Syncephalis fuscata]|nr:P-loop containing nucleoside triphosphate hydrolase protein [Syncephalis fuscata]